MTTAAAGTPVRVRKRAVVTGGTGFVGANLARRLLHDGHDVHLLVRPGYAPWRIEAIRAAVQIHEVAFADDAALTRLLRAIKPDWVFHLAAHGAYASQTDVWLIVQTNVVETINLVQACLAIGVEALINTGSSSEYGFKDHAPTEDEPIQPASAYAVTKASATMFCQYAARKDDVHLPTLRLYSVYGPYEEPTRLIPAVIVRGMRGELPPLVDPTVARDYVSVHDVCEAYLLAAMRPTEERGAIYNVGTGIQTSLRAVVDVAGQALPIRGEPAWGSMPNRQWDTTTWVANSAKIRHALGWQPRDDFATGFREMVAWFESNPALRQFYTERVMGPT